jgi:hypothetical protein
MDGEHTLGSEADLQFQVETPRGAKWELAAGWFFHGSALKRLFRDEPWTLSASVSINID